MAPEDRKALIYRCQEAVAHLTQMVEVGIRGGRYSVTEYRYQLMINEIALAAMTAQPVKLPDNVPCKGAPQFVWLQVSCDTGNPSEWPEHPEAGVTWHTEQIHSDDVLYIRASSDEVQE